MALRWLAAVMVDRQILVMVSARLIHAGRSAAFLPLTPSPGCSRCPRTKRKRSRAWNSSAAFWCWPAWLLALGLSNSYGAAPRRERTDAS